MIVLVLWIQLMLLSSVVLSSFYDDEDCDTFGPEALTNVNEWIHMSERECPFKVDLSSKVYGNESSITVNIEVPNNSSFIVQMRNIQSKKRVGMFEAKDASYMTSLVCHKFNRRLIATTRPLTSSNVSFQWLPPRDDRGTLALMGIFVSGNEYWIIKEDGKKLRYHGNSENRTVECIERYVSGHFCEKKKKCEHGISYEVNDYRTSMNIKMRQANITKDVYLGLAFATDVNQKIDETMVISCARVSQQAKIADVTKIEVIFGHFDFENNVYTCIFVISLEQLDQTRDRFAYLAYFWGYINSKTGKIILPPAQNIRESFQPIVFKATTGNLCHLDHKLIGYRWNSSISQFSAPAIIFIVMLTFIVKIITPG